MADLWACSHSEQAQTHQIQESLKAVVSEAKDVAECVSTTQNYRVVERVHARLKEMSMDLKASLFRLDTEERALQKELEEHAEAFARWGVEDANAAAAEAEEVEIVRREEEAAAGAQGDESHEQSPEEIELQATTRPRPEPQGRGVCCRLRASFGHVPRNRTGALHGTVDSARYLPCQSIGRGSTAF